METPFTPVEVFYSCSDSPVDIPLLDQLERHLSVLRHEGLITTWHKRRIVAGSDWQVELDQHLNMASLILLLISPDFLASEYQYGIELQRAMQRHDANEACVIPIALRACDWESTPFRRLQVVPRNGKAITSWRNRDEAFVEIAKEIRIALNNVQRFTMNAPSSLHSAVWNVPYLRNPHFTGRDELLDLLDKELSQEAQNNLTPMRRAALTQPQAIKGLGGIGKTQIAIEYAYRSRELNRYAHTFWVNAASEEALLTSFAELADLLPAFPARGEADQHKLVKAIKRWLEQCKQSWLLIFDNADDIALIRYYLPQQGLGSILLTTRANAVGSLAASLEVETMGFIEGTHLLLRRAQRFEHASDEEINQAGNIVVTLDHFPLALDQAGAYIEETQCSLGEYLHLYETHRQALLARRGTQTTDYPDSIATTWLLSFQKVQQANPAAAELLELCSFLAPDRIPEELFRDGATYWPASLQHAVADAFLFQELIADLLKFSLVRRLADKHTFSMHRLVQAVQKDRMEFEMQRHWAERIVQAINDMFPDDPGDPAAWPQCLQYLDQAQACHMLIEDYELALVAGANVLDRTGTYLHDHALYAIAEPLYQHALSIREEQLGPQHPDTAHSLNNLALLYKTQGKYEQAEPLYVRALSIYEQQLGLEHPDTANSLNNLAALYKTQGKYEQTELLYNRALSIREQQLGPQHPDTAQSLNNLAHLYFDQGKYEQAELLHQRALSIREQQLGPQHPDTVRSLGNLATLYYTQGKYEQAEPLLVRVLSIREQLWGPQHPDTAHSLNNLAVLYKAQGKYEQTEPLLVRALSIREQQLGPQHPETARSLGNLAALYETRGKYGQAEPLYNRALSIREEQLGPEHPDTANSLNNLAVLYKAQGKYEQAEPLLVRALSIREKQLGLQHPYTAHSLNNLAALYKVQGKYEQAEPLYVRALSIREQQLRPEHPDIASSLGNLAELYRAQGKYEQAEPLYVRALSIYEQQLGREHSATQTVRENYVTLLRTIGRNVEAKRLEDES